MVGAANRNRLTLLTSLLALFIPHAAVNGHAQAAVAAVDDSPAFISGSFLLSSGFRATADPEGPGYLHDTFHGTFDWPAPGAMVNGGVFVTRHWSVGGAWSFTRMPAVTVTQGSFTHSEFTEGTSLYSSREQLLSVIVRRHAATATIAVEPLAGFTLARTTRALTDRHDVYHWFGGTIQRTLPDRTATEFSRGIVGGGEVAVRLAPGWSLVSGARLHWLPGRQESEYASNHIGLRSPAYVLQIGSGVSWRPARR